MSDSDSNGTTSTENPCVPARPKGRGKGRRQTGHMPKSSAKAKAAKSSKSLKAQMSQMKKQSCQSLKPSFVPEDQCDSTETSESEESKRIQMAEKAWNTKKSGNKIMERSDDDIQNLTFDCINQGRPKTSSLGDVVSWLLENVVTQDEMQRVTDASEGFTCKIGEFCAGMATGSFCSKIISDVIFQMCGNRISLDTVLVSEMVKWKMDVCKTVCHACGDTPKFICRTGDEAKEAIPVTCQWVVAAIECDDISSCSTTPKSVLDESGKSGRSFIELLQYIEKVSPRPKVIMLECVSGLMKNRQSVGEKGTQVVTEKLEMLGYVGSWRMLNSLHFFVPHSRTRAYGCFLYVSSFDDALKLQSMTMLEAIWKFVGRCQSNSPESLETLLLRSGLMDSSNVEAKKRKTLPNPSTVDSKWKKEHADFREKHHLQSDDNLSDVAKQILLDVGSFVLPLTPREAELSALGVTKTLLENPGCRVMVGDIGNSIRFCKFRHQVHPCLLPSEKYLYVLNGKAVLNNHSSLVPFALQSFGKNEVLKMGLEDLPLKQARDLCGNSFTGSVAASLMLAILIEYFLKQ